MKSEDEHSDKAWKVQKKLSRKDKKEIDKKNYIYKYCNRYDLLSEDNEDEEDDEDEEGRHDITYEMRREIEEGDRTIRFL